jgi:hypothetical protein
VRSLQLAHTLKRVLGNIVCYKKWIESTYHTRELKIINTTVQLLEMDSGI